MLTHEMGVVRAFHGFLFGMSLWAYRRELARLPYADGILLGLVGLFIVGAIVGADQKIMFALTYGIAATALAADQAGHPNALSRWIAPLGVLTYGIYMPPPILRSLGYPLMMASGFESNLAITICWLFVFPAAYLSYFWFERTDKSRVWKEGCS